MIPLHGLHKCREICRSLEFVAQNVDSESRTEIVAISLYLTPFEADWKRYSEIFPILCDRCETIVTGNDRLRYLLPLIGKQKRAFSIGPPAVTCRPVGHASFVKDVVISDAFAMSRRIALMWNDVTPFSLVSCEHIVVWEKKNRDYDPTRTKQSIVVK
jgi:hypothetical protein